MPSDQVERMPFAQPQFWAGQELGWSVMVRIDGQTWGLMGISDSDAESILPATVHRAEFTATHSVFDLLAGSVALTLDFFSPVSPSNYVRQSLPFSYLTVRVKNAQDRHIQLYSDIDGRWTGQRDRSVHAFEAEGELMFHALSVKDAPEYEEHDDMAIWGKAILASRSQNRGNLSALAGDAHIVRSNFAEGGQLSGRVSSWSPEGVVALAHDLGKLSHSDLVTFAVGYERDHAIDYLGEPYTGFYKSEFPTTAEALSFFFDDFEDSERESWHLDQELSTLSTATAGPKYADIVALSLRQVWGGIDLTIPDMSKDPDSVMAFIKELSSDGNVNTVDVIMPAFPIFWVMDPNWIRLLLEPVMLYLESGRWRLPYAIHDIGTHYPRAVGHDDQEAEPMPIEECGNLLILALAYVRATADHNWSDRYMPVFQKYADYLVENGVNITEQLSSNDAAGPLTNETNLAIKAAIGIVAYGELSRDEKYTQIGNEHATLFFEQGLGTDENRTHFTLLYPDQPGTWKIPYNLYPDLLLGLETFPAEAYLMGSQFFQNPRPHTFGAQGYPLSNGAAPSGPAPGAVPLLPNNGRLIQNGPTRILCIADVRGNLKSLNELAKQARADHIIHTGDFGFYDDTSLERIADKTLKHVAQYSPLLPENVKRTIAQVPPQQSIKQRFTPDQLPLSELPMLLDKRISLDVPVYTVWGACEDVRVLEKFRSGEYKVNNLHIIDEANSRLLDIGGVKLRLLGLGGAVVMHKLFDNGEGKTTIAGGQGTMWTTLLQMGELIDTAHRVYDPSETRVFVTHASPAREGMLNQLSVTLKADFSISAGLHFRYGSSYNEFSVNPSLDHYRGKLAASKASFTDVWETVRGEVESAISSNEAQKTLLDNALDVVQKMPSIANGGNPFGGPVAAGNAAGQVDESAFKNMWNFNLADAAFGYLVLEIEAGRIATEMRAQGFNFAHRSGKPVPGGAQPAPGALPATTASPAPTGAGGRPPASAPQFGQAPPVTSGPAAGQGKAQPARGSPVPVIPKAATPQPPASTSAQPTGEEKVASTGANGHVQQDKPSESTAPRGEKKPSNGLFVSNVDSEQKVRDLLPEEDKAKATKIERYGKFNYVVTFPTVEDATAALERQPIEHKKPTTGSGPRKPNFKYFEERPRAQGNAGTWQSSTRGGATSGQRGYQSASDSEGARRGGFGGRGRGRGDRGRGGRGGRGGFKPGSTDASSIPSGDKPAPSGGEA
ncbi:hypothetical protein POX_e07286 [Penicillium oxalicum]|uniref:hypothetical protein n=1 Tax=Penicillium oxalicum TaxID=69781 RepID=UPI0020B8E2E1|nr:hypothetical protein POX_e07286 [Penicillium oxalicum]KAI2789256.1 hypothetical protein POX_e07286 [Penicillium oxalicum]